MIKIALCDDNEFQRELMEDIIDEYRKLHNSAEISLSIFAGGRDLLNSVKENGFYDIYILDLIMPDINGMETAATLRTMKDTGKIIFLTATLDYAVASYDVDAFYYMLKPVDQSKLFKVLDKACEEFTESDSSINLKTRTGIVKIKYEDILYVSLENRALRFNLKDGKMIDGMAIRVPFKDSVAQLLTDARFSLCGVSMVVNLDYLDQMDSESLLLSDGTILYPSKAACNALKKAWQERRK